MPKRDTAMRSEARDQMDHRRAISTRPTADSTPDSVRSSVVLPAPFEPIRATISPRLTSSETPLMTAIRPLAAMQERQPSAWVANALGMSAQIGRIDSRVIPRTDCGEPGRNRSGRCPSPLRDQISSSRA